MSDILEITMETAASEPSTTAKLRSYNGPVGMAQFWREPENAVLVKVGYLLAKIERGKSLAQHLVEGKTLRLPHVVAPDGTKLPIADGFVLKLESKAAWFCPACSSAHGTSEGKSATGSRNSGPNAANLAGNVFYYRPADKTLLVFSDSCFRKYVKDTGHTSRLVAGKSTIDVKAIVDELREIAATAPKVLPETASTPATPHATPSKGKSK